MIECETSIEPGREHPKTSLDVLVGRQPIFDRQLDVIGYELLYRHHADHNSADFDDPEEATTRVVLAAFLDIGLDRIVGRFPAYINLTRGLVLGKLPLSLPADRVVLELLENVKVDAQLVAGLRGLSQQGYRIALDDYVYHESHGELLELADVIKIDVQALSSADVKAQYALLRGYKAELMAEKVETHAQFQFCRDLGFDSFQGYFLCRPNIIHGSPVQTNRLTTFQILSALQDSQLGQAELIQLLSKHDFLGRKFVRLMHQVSPADVKGGLTVSKAVCLAGVEQSKVWLTLICLSARSTKPAELLNMALVRAKMCELLAVASGFTKPDQSYRVGLFSVLDALFDLPMNRIIGVLPLPMNMKQALNGLGGALGDILKCVTSYEQGDWNSVHWADLDMSSIRDAYCASVGWAETLSEQLRALP